MIEHYEDCSAKDCWCGANAYNAGFEAGRRAERERCRTLVECCMAVSCDSLEAREAAEFRCDFCALRDAIAAEVPSDV